MPDDQALERWLRHEMAGIQNALVRNPIPLLELLAANSPQTSTRGGEAYRFDPDALRAVAARLSPLGRAVLRLPILFYLDREAPGSCFVSDPGQAQALAELGIVRSDPREGRQWLSEPLAREFARAHPTLAQFVMV